LPVCLLLTPVGLEPELVQSLAHNGAAPFRNAGELSRQLQGHILIADRDAPTLCPPLRGRRVSLVLGHDATVGHPVSPGRP
jgi:hypothetical protein